MIIDRAEFIAAQTRLLPVPLAPEIVLHMAEEAVALWQKTEDGLGEMGLPPPFWAFAWAGGQALARHVLDHPGLVAGKHVLDFAAGSGLVAIAAANSVVIQPREGDLLGHDEGWDVVFAGDIFYDRDIAAAAFGWLAALRQRGALVLIGDPGRIYLPRERLVAVAEYRVPVTRGLEDVEVKQSTVWALA